MPCVRLHNLLLFFRAGSVAQKSVKRRFAYAGPLVRPRCLPDNCDVNAGPDLQRGSAWRACRTRHLGPTFMQSSCLWRLTILTDTLLAASTFNPSGGLCARTKPTFTCRYRLPSCSPDLHLSRAALFISPASHAAHELWLSATNDR